MKQSFNPVQQTRRAIRLTRKARHVVRARMSVGKNYTFSVDSPRKRIIEKRELAVEGWIIAKKPGTFQLRVRNNGNIYPLVTGLKRLDVAKSHPAVPKEAALYSGFAVEFEFEDGIITIELNEGNGFKKLYDTTVQYGIENLPAAIYNQELSNNYPEHVNLLDNRQKFYYEEAALGTFKPHEKDARTVAIYLPQFHPFAENDKAWGKGFTEWNNVTTGQPRFVGHQQPILPKDLGFYDLRLDSKILEQIELAKKFGIYGFCIYYYWFSGKKLMEGPLNTIVAHKEWDFHFSICWANENWTKRWDGRDSDVIIAQEYLDDDPLNFIKDVEHILLDPRYITEDDKPVLMVYRAAELKDPKKYVKIWREYFRKEHGKELQLVSFLSFDDQDPREYGFDVALDFAPLSAFFKNHLFEENQFPYIDISQKLLDINFSGVVADYRTIALNSRLQNSYNFPTYPCVTPSWDNDARKKGKGFVYQNSSPDVYAEWLKRVVNAEVLKKPEPLIFVNAWNEWAEGAIMEPSMHLGHAVLNRTAEALAQASHDASNAETFPSFGLVRQPEKKLAVVLHLYYVDLWPLIRDRLSLIGEPFDLFVTLNVRNSDFVPELDNPDVKVSTFVLPNRGRDVLPFLFVARRLKEAGYEYVLKLHSKKSKHRADGSNWFAEVLEALLPDQTMIESSLNQLADKKTGLIGPAKHLVSLKAHMGSNKLILRDLLKRSYGELAARQVIDNPEKFPYFGGTMFWARLDTFDSILNLVLMPDDFQSEHGQIDGTTAHAIERLFGVVSKLEHRQNFFGSSAGIEQITVEDFNEKYKYAP